MYYGLALTWPKSKHWPFIAHKNLWGPFFSVIILAHDRAHENNIGNMDLAVQLPKFPSKVSFYKFPLLHKIKLKNRKNRKVHDLSKNLNPPLVLK